VSDLGLFPPQARYARPASAAEATALKSEPPAHASLARGRSGLERSHELSRRDDAFYPRRVAGRWYVPCAPASPCVTAAHTRRSGSGRRTPTLCRARTWSHSHSHRWSWRAREPSVTSEERARGSMHGVMLSAENARWKPVDFVLVEQHQTTLRSFLRY
jgi:hypothetical protein